VSSYTPTLSALLRAQQNQHTLPASQVKVVTITADHAQDLSMPALRYVTEEARSVTSIFTSAGASANSDAQASTKADVVALLESANVVHLACHGIQHGTEPHKSRFCLSTGSLSVAELMEMDLQHAFVAFLSACETAKGAENHADEVVHLAATMLFAGFKSVIATMW
jgi:CHAT domain-containing protein